MRRTEAIAILAPFTQTSIYDQPREGLDDAALCELDELCDHLANVHNLIDYVGLDEAMRRLQIRKLSLRSAKKCSTETAKTAARTAYLEVASVVDRCAEFGRLLGLLREDEDAHVDDGEAYKGYNESNNGYVAIVEVGSLRVRSRLSWKAAAEKTLVLLKKMARRRSAELLSKLKES